MTETITLINVFTVPLDESEHFLGFWRRRADIMAAQPGFLRARMYRAVHDDTQLRFINVAEWVDEKALEDALAEANSQAPPQRLAASNVTSRPAVYRLAVEVPPTGSQ